MHLEGTAAQGPADPSTVEESKAPKAKRTRAAARQTSQSALSVSEAAPAENVDEIMDGDEVVIEAIEAS